MKIIEEKHGWRYGIVLETVIRNGRRLARVEPHDAKMTIEEWPTESCHVIGKCMVRW